MPSNDLRFAGKSSAAQIRARFDADVDRFSNLETGQSATMDAVLCLDLVARAAAGCTPRAERLLDLGCGAGNFTLRLRQHLPIRHVTLADLSAPMLQRARERTEAAGIECETCQGDMREIRLEPESMDVIVAGASLHHLRGDDEWEQMFQGMVTALRPGGSLWIFDLVGHELEAVEALQRERYAAYLREIGGDDYAERVFAYIEAEDSPRPVLYQVELLRQNGLSGVDILHKNSCFAAFGGQKPTRATTLEYGEGGD